MTRKIPYQFSTQVTHPTEIITLISGSTWILKNQTKI